jgi:hypothetical protein
MMDAVSWPADALPIAARRALHKNRLIATGRRDNFRQFLMFPPSARVFQRRIWFGD